ncbi:MAG: methyltransferase domain-containing protein [Alsobacter sp.]
MGRLMMGVNASPNRQALAALDLQPGDKVLEIGFGPGVALAEILRRSDGPHAGVDVSATMVGMATRRNREAVRAGRLTLVHGPATTLPWRDHSFDKALLVNVLYFTESSALDLLEARRVLRPGGVLVAYVTDRSTMRRWPFAQEDTHRHFDAAGLRSTLALAGFEPDRVAIRPLALPLGVIGLLAVASTPP